MVEPLRHRQTKGAETDMFDLQPPRHISTLPEIEVARRPRFGRDRVESRHEADIGNRSFVTHLRHWLCTAATVSMPAFTPIEMLI